MSRRFGRRRHELRSLVTGIATWLFAVACTAALTLWAIGQTGEQVTWPSARLTAGPGGFGDVVLLPIGADHARFSTGTRDDERVTSRATQTGDRAATGPQPTGSVSTGASDPATAGGSASSPTSAGGGAQPTARDEPRSEDDEAVASVGGDRPTPSPEPTDGSAAAPPPPTGAATGEALPAASGTPTGGSDRSGAATPSPTASAAGGAASLAPSDTAVDAAQSEARLAVSASSGGTRSSSPSAIGSSTSTGSVPPGAPSNAAGSTSPSGSPAEALPGRILGASIRTEAGAVSITCRGAELGGWSVLPAQGWSADPPVAEPGGIRLDFVQGSRSTTVQAGCSDTTAPSLRVVGGGDSG